MWYLCGMLLSCYARYGDAHSMAGCNIRLPYFWGKPRVLYVELSLVTLQRLR